MKSKKLLLLLSLIAFIVNISKAQQSDLYSIFITGNTEGKIQNSELLKIWKQSSLNSENHAILLLGDIYNDENKNFSDELFIGNKNPLLLAPGKKEWANGSSSGKDVIKNIEDELEKAYNGPFYMPDAACPGPKEIILNENLVVILLDTYWWLHKHDRRFTKCDIETTVDILVQIEDAIQRHYPTKHIVIAGHNSLKSFGNSDGYFSFKQTVLEFPYTLYRKIFGTRKDNHHPDFKGFRDAMLSILKKYPDIIYVSSGDDNLQYFTLDQAHHIISGSMMQTGFVRSDLAEFGSSEKGFARLDFSNEGDCELIFTGVNGEIFHKTIYNKTFVNDVELKNIIRKLPDSMTVKASNKYNIPKSHYFLMGENYRTIWNTDVKVPVFDIGSKKGGLHIVKRGGGKQTHSLRLEDENGRQYVLRSFEKYVEGFLPDELNNTFAIDIVQDQISAANPYAALVVAQLAEFAGIFHTNPETVYGPDDPRFGVYRQDIAGQLYIFEERPDKDRSDVASFGYSKNIISTDEMTEMIFNDNNHSIDANAFLRARLFDILINDWDRHGDQWRWAGFNNNNKTIYKPIPRDRDQAFFINEGVLPRLASNNWLISKIQGFDEFTENINGHSFNARYIDRTFLIHSDWNDWLQQIDSLKILLKPDKIDKAVLSFPKEIQPLCADYTAEILKARLKNLEPMTRKLYLSLAKEVNITGTNEEDIFEIIAHNDTTIHITGFHLKNKKETEIYSRTFYSSETKKIHIYGFDKKDIFIIKGKAKNKINIIIISGNDDDKVIYKDTKVPKFITIYDKKSTNLSPLLKSRIKISYDKKELAYDNKAFKYNVVYPGLFMGYNQDDGLFLGGGPIINKYSRYHSQEYKIFANYAISTDAFNFYFSGKNIYPLKRFEWGLIADIKSPNYVNNFFGMGNETKWQVEKSEKEYYWVRMREYYAKTDFAKVLDENEIHKASIGIFYKNTDVEATPDRFIFYTTQNGLNPDAVMPHSFTGVCLNYTLNTILKQEKKEEKKFEGNNMFPTRGMKLETTIAHFIGLDVNSQDFTKISGEWSSYISFSQRPRVVYKIKLGGEKLFGDYVFTEAAKLGQKYNLRGFRYTRFYGDANLYLNTEMRIRVKQFNTYILNGTAGLMLFNDVGRVWYEGENSSRWHDGYGIGLWWSPFDMAVFTTNYARSNEENLINVSLNYKF